MTGKTITVRAGTALTTSQTLTLTLSLTLSIAVALAGSNAHAAENQGWYGGLNLGRSHLGLDAGKLDNRFANQGLTTSSSIASSDTGYSLVGGYQVSRNFALEGNYVDFGRYNYSTAVTAPAAGSISGRYSARGYGLAAVGILPLGQGFSAYGKAGLAYTRAQIEANASAGIAASGARSSGTNGLFGAGLSYDFTKNIAGKVEWNRYLRVGDANSGRSDIDLYTVGVAYKF